jgi:hypothetical protein
MMAWSAPHILHVTIARACGVGTGLESRVNASEVFCFTFATQVRRSWVGASTGNFVGALLNA